MLLSAAIIVRDEADHLDACLQSLSGLVDEIVVVDTGSSDDSVAVAHRHGAIVAHEPWQGDFATPRNRSLDLASGEWILYIDADERVRAGDPQERRERIAASAEFEALRIPLVPRVGWTPYVEYRLWRHRADVRFSGRMHESIVGSIHAAAKRAGLRVGISDVITLDHLGYEGDQRHKHARDEPILLAALAENPTRVYYYDHLARIYHAQSRDEEAVSMWTRGIEMARAREHPDHDDRLLWVDLIWHRVTRADAGDDVAALVYEALERFPRLPVLEFVAAQLEFSSGEHASAQWRVEWILSRSELDALASGSSYDARIFGEWSWNLLGLCRFADGDWTAAAEAFAKAERAAPTVKEYAVRRALARARAESAESRDARRPPG
jgi:glycosyltransferase involved in cell wall biosynthesis